MRSLNIVEKNNIFQFHRIADNAVFSDKRIAADKSTVPHFRTAVNYARTVYPCRGVNDCILRNPNVFLKVSEFLWRKGRTDFENCFADFVQRLPRIFAFAQKIRRTSFGQIKKFICFIHFLPSKFKVSNRFKALPRRTARPLIFAVQGPHALLRRLCCQQPCGILPLSVPPP